MRQPGDESEFDDAADVIPFESAELPGLVPIFKPMPIDLLPKTAADYITETAGAIGCDPSMVAQPFIPAAMSAIGASVAVEVKRDSWTEPFVAWTSVVAGSGNNKSSAANAGTKPVADRHEMALKEYFDALNVYESEFERWESANKGKRNKTDAPHKPVAVRSMIGDATIEALIDVLGENPRGVLAKYDELSGLFKSFGQYKRAGGGADVALWLAMFRAESLTVDRKVNKQVRFIPRACVSITGGIQPTILKSCLGTENFENGMAARFLFCQPPESPKRWTDDEPDPRVVNHMNSIFAALHRIPCNERPFLLPFSKGAKQVLQEFVNRHGEETAACDGALRMAFSKLEAYAFRFAGLFHLLEFVDCREITGNSLGEISERHLCNAIELVEWYGREIERVYLGLSEEQTEVSQLVRLISEFGGRITARELQRRKRRKYGKAADAIRALDQVRKAGFGHWGTDATTGRPATVLILGRCQ